MSRDRGSPAAPGQRGRQVRLAAHLDPGDKTAGCDRRASSDGAPHQSLRDHERQAVLDEATRRGAGVRRLAQEFRELGREILDAPRMQGPARRERKPRIAAAETVREPEAERKRTASCDPFEQVEKREPSRVSHGCGDRVRPAELSMTTR